METPAISRSAKAAAIGGATLVLPFGRVASASANQAEPCFELCVGAAKKGFDDATKNCDKARGGKGIVQSIGPIRAADEAIGFLRRFLGRQRRARCYASAELVARRQAAKCLQPQCGNPNKYPGGNPISKPKGCDPGSILCGDDCCDPSYSHCGGCAGSPVCCRNGATRCSSEGNPTG